MDEATAVLVIIGAAILAFSLITIPLGYIVVYFGRRLMRWLDRRRGDDEEETTVITMHLSSNGHVPVSKKD